MNFTKTSHMVSLLIVGLGLAVNGYSQSWVTNGLVAYYPFNGNANDASGNGNNGTVNGAVLTTDRFGHPQSCYAFNGVSTYIRLPLNTGNLNGSTQATLTAWIKPNKIQVACIFSHWVNHFVSVPTPVGIMFSIYYPQYQPMLPVSQLMGCLASDSDSVYATNAVPTNQWTFVTMVFDGTQSASNRTRLFNNGVLAGVTYQNASAIPFGVGNLATDTIIGATASQNGLIAFASGSLDDIRIYNRALSVSEVQQLYAYESAPACIPHGATATATLNHGFVVDAIITDGGCGYTNMPVVLIQGDGGIGATATAVVSNGVVVGITITDAGFGYTSPPNIYISAPIGVQVGLLRAVQPFFSNLLPGTKYQLELSSTMSAWTNYGAPFTATNINMVYPQSWYVDNWNSLYFRLKVSP